MDEESGWCITSNAAANAGDVTQVHKLLHGRKTRSAATAGYTGADKRDELRDVTSVFLIAEKPSKLRAMKNQRDRPYAERWERFKSQPARQVEHPFRVIKRQFGYTKGALPWSGKEHGAGADPVHVVESVDGAPALAAGDGGSASIRRKNPPRCALLFGVNPPNQTSIVALRPGMPASEVLFRLLT